MRYILPRHPSKVAIKEPTMYRSASATKTDAELAIAPWISTIVSVTLGNVPAARHNLRSASASSGRHSRMKNGSVRVFVLSDTSTFVSGAVATAPIRFRKGQPIRQANSSCFADFCRLLRSDVLLPVDGARRERVGSPHFQAPTPVRRHHPERLSRFGASYRAHCRQ